MIIQYCTDCGGPLAQKSPFEYRCERGHWYYNNARGAVTVLFTKNGKLLYAQRAKNPHKGKFDFPGGFVDPGETLEQTAVREIAEELGVQLQHFTYLTSAPNNYFEDAFTCDAVFLADAWLGTPTANDDVARLVWRDVDFICSDEFAWECYKPLVEQIKTAVFAVGATPESV